MPKIRNMVVMVYAAYIFHLRHLVSLLCDFSDGARDVMLQSYVVSEDERYH